MESNAPLGISSILACHMCSSVSIYCTKTLSCQILKHALTSSLHHLKDHLGQRSLFAEPGSVMLTVGFEVAETPAQVEPFREEKAGVEDT